MRKLVLATLTLLLGSSRVHAEPFVELAGGLVAPVSDDDWTSFVDPSFKLAARVGGGGPGVGGMLSVDWTPLSEDADFLSINRFRVLGHIQLRNQVARNVTLSGRFGAGLDIIHESASVMILGTTFEGSDSDLGIAFEAAAGAWFGLGSTTQLGVEVAVPIGYHSSSGNPNNPNDPNDAKFEYTTVDLDVLVGIRFGM